MAGIDQRGLRPIAGPYPVSGPTGVAVRTRLKHLTVQDEKVLRMVGAHLSSLAAADLKARCADGLDHDSTTWAERKRVLTPECSSRWAGSITKATHDQWALARRVQAAHLRSVEAGVATIRHRLSLPVGAKSTRKKPGGYRSRQEWHAKSRRLATLENRLAIARADFEAGKVSVVRGGKHLARNRHHLANAGLTESSWRERWEARRWFLQADGESGKRFGNETIRITPQGEVSIKLPAPLKEWANAPHCRYRLSGKIAFAHRGREWAGRVKANRAVAYRVHLDVERGRWYITASWQTPTTPQIPLRAALTEGVIGVDMNADHLAAWRLDTHGNPLGDPRRFDYQLSGTASHRDAQVRHALSGLLRWAHRCGVKAVAVEDLDFMDSKTRERHGGRKRFRQVISGMPTGRLKARLTSMADATAITIIAVDAAYTSRWGAQHWQKPTTSRRRKTSRHDAASIVIGRRAQGHPIRRRTAPPPHHRSDGAGHRTVQARSGARGGEGIRLSGVERAHDARAQALEEGERGGPVHPTPFGVRAGPGVASDVTPAHC
ncbi:IS200/IS605 family accessory protein TnpB-related protein [Nocardiopsis sp. NPDC006832]|uniref:IS200/IS605 family accessory protein TnpB-related protein n=1 Tax=Nocardiopsis sp. NPDC006832 TaxID=3157188 RepID=UPI0033C54915